MFKNAAKSVLLPKPVGQAITKSVLATSLAAFLLLNSMVGTGFAQSSPSGPAVQPDQKAQIYKKLTSLLGARLYGVVSVGDLDKIQKDYREEKNEIDEKEIKNLSGINNDIREHPQNWSPEEIDESLETVHNEKEQDTQEALDDATDDFESSFYDIKGNKIDAPSFSQKDITKIKKVIREGASSYGCLRLEKGCILVLDGTDQKKFSLFQPGKDIQNFFEDLTGVKAMDSLLDPEMKAMLSIHVVAHEMAHGADPSYDERSNVEREMYGDAVGGSTAWDICSDLWGKEKTEKFYTLLRAARSISSVLNVDCAHATQFALSNLIKTKAPDSDGFAPMSLETQKKGYFDFIKTASGTKLSGEEFYGKLKCSLNPEEDFKGCDLGFRNPDKLKSMLQNEAFLSKLSPEAKIYAEDIRASFGVVDGFVASRQNTLELPSRVSLSGAKVSSTGPTLNS